MTSTTTEDNKNIEEQQTSESESTTLYKAGDPVWAKLRGYPWWPSKVADESELTEDVLAVKPASKSIPVYFYGSYDYGWMTLDNVKKFQENFEQFTKKKSTKMFEQALAESQDPELFAKVLKEIEAEKKMKESKKRKVESEEPEENDEQVSEEEVSEAEEEAEEEFQNEKPSKKKSKTNRDSDRFKASTTPNGKKEKAKRRKSEQTSSSKKSRKVNGADRYASSITEPISSSTNADYSTERLLRLRMKIQKFQQTQHKTEKDFEKLLNCLNELIDYPFDFDKFKETKIGKIVRKLSSLDIVDDKFDVRGKATALIEKWKVQMVILEENKEAPQDMKVEVVIPHVANVVKEPFSPQTTAAPEKSGEENKDEKINSEEEKNSINGNGESTEEELNREESKILKIDNVEKECVDESLSAIKIEQTENKIELPPSDSKMDIDKSVDYDQMKHEPLEEIKPDIVAEKKEIAEQENNKSPALKAAEYLMLAPETIASECENEKVMDVENGKTESVNSSLDNMVSKVVETAQEEIPASLTKMIQPELKESNLSSLVKDPVTVPTVIDSDSVTKTTESVGEDKMETSA